MRFAACSANMLTKRKYLFMIELIYGKSCKYLGF